MAQNSFCEIYIHLVWRTKHNRRTLGGALERFAHRRLREIGESLRLDTLAIDSAWDHIHAYFRWHPSTAVADAVRTMKSKTSGEWNNPIPNGTRTGDRLYWQTGYGAVSTRKSDVPMVQRYVDTQKQRHRHDATWEPYERIDYDETNSDDTADRDAAA